MRQLQRIFDDVRGELDRLAKDGKGNGKGKAGLQSRLMTVLDKAGDLMRQVDPDMSITRTADGTRATVSGKADQATLERIATKLRAAIGAGVIDITPHTAGDAVEAPTLSKLGRVQQDGRK